MIKNLIINVVINGIILYFIHKYDLGFRVTATEYDVYVTFVILGFVFWFFNFILKGILKILTLPLKILTFGISSIIINVLVIYMFEYVVNSFQQIFEYKLGILISLGTVLQVLVLSFIITLSYILIKKII